ncbi:MULTISPECIES: ribonucleotide-diphosphate reductase subunit beta [Cytobacillus]|jgi:ribonucleoside-diphosphate reductase beta chain|uniref:Ribonucleoside-diphosphate reductase subunit beta n=1 Tax=Cytobacillus pseudoceanisediminis TaxID=3051614 RepID=A0ABZ2ZE44_9BACI|nr:ribonucleotide-diphosphate reductase subunit beta [Cytobacillus oceanisediminis]EFV74019.1 ribonucleoside-diphosphate reductase beta subunit [Bacillus sp. 2_A_57_CT2]MBU8733062.1 ribonucleotide-diphosphate reductase subunit beta [Cytobacillus oceanisediminis]MCM3246780.1 ribonucleotide-diphosphate reductase subunit beta [Cytobacillus oceanisediminis]MCM3405442.1 ribonucleotide-diphosphate reductase subunit beta [Cytobacillus oceanisediminis]MDK7668885.1 ribonucleotide-diphosphate reductase 
MNTLEKRPIINQSAPNKSTSIINGECSNILNWDDVRFSWAYPKYKKMLANFWTPFEINMSQDIKQFPELRKSEQEAFLKIIGLLALLDSIQTDYAGKVADYITDSSISALMIILAQQEVIHNHSYSYVLSSLVPKQKQDEVFEFWRTEPILAERNEFVVNGYKDFAENPSAENLLKSIVFDVVLEGLFFYSGFAFFYHLARNQKMVATSTMINYINRDEQIHVDLFVKIFKEILQENPELNTNELSKFVQETFKRAAELEIEWARDVIGSKTEGILLSDVEAYIKFYANIRCNQLGYERPFEGYRTNPLRWIVAYEQVDHGKSDFFEQKSRQYTKVQIDNGFDEL